MSDEVPTLKDYVFLRDIAYGGPLNDLPIRNFYEGIDAEIVANNSSNLSEDHLNAILALRNMLGTIALIQGARGTGKMHFLKQQCRVITEQRARDVMDNRFKIQILCPLTGPLEALGIAVKEELSDIRISSKPPLVIRLGNLDSENDNMGENKGLMDDMRATQVSLGLAPATESAKISLSYWILVISGIVETQDSAIWKEAQRFENLACLWNEYIRKVSLDEEKSEALTVEINYVIDYVLRLATVCLVTISNGASDKMWNSFFPSHQFIVQCENAKRIHLPMILAGYEKAYARVFMGDNTNEAGGSILEHLKSRGFPTVTFTHQHSST